MDILAKKLWYYRHCRTDMKAERSISILNYHLIESRKNFSEKTIDASFSGYSFYPRENYA